MNIRLDNPNQPHPEVEVHEVLDSIDEMPNVALRRVTIIVVTLFWVGQFGANTFFTQLNAPEMAISTLLPRAIVCLAGAIISLGSIAIQERWRSSRLKVRAYWAIAFTLMSSALLGSLNYNIFMALTGDAGTSGFWMNLAMQFIPRLWVFGSIYAIALVISYAADVRKREEEIAGLRALAQDAQLRALRSQLNPHFLFNALNSIAALIREGGAEKAEQTTEHLADFLRETLSLDPHRLIRVEEEVSLQQIYLDIQKVRFPARLNVTFDIGEDARKAKVPNLILQPLIENSIAHAVARSTAPVSVQVRARVEMGKLRIVVEDDGGNSAGQAPARGHGIGLANVAERLSAQFGREADFSAGPQDGGGFRNVILIPLVRGS